MKNREKYAEKYRKCGGLSQRRAQRRGLWRRGPSLLVAGALLLAAFGPVGPATAAQAAPPRATGPSGLADPSQSDHTYETPDIVANADGRLEAFIRQDDGTVFHAWQTSPGSGWSTWRPLTGSGAVGFGPSAVRNTNGRLEAFAITPGHKLEHAWQEQPGGEQWHDWQVMGAPNVPLLCVTATQNADGRLEVFTLGTNGHLYHIFQETPFGHWSAWHDLGGNLIALPALARNVDGRLEAFEIDQNHHMVHDWQTSANGPNSEWATGWTQLGDGETFAGAPAAVSNKDGRLEVFGTTDSGYLKHAWQVGHPAGPWSAFDTMAAISPGITVSGPPVVAVDADGRLEVFVLGNDRSIYHSWQNDAGSSVWSAWRNLIGVLTDPLAVTSNRDGRLEMVALTPGGFPLRNAQVTADSPNWTHWSTLPYDPHALVWNG
ncbi:hypothetical protein KDL01_29145 [Actinospica durhamensis]|uniref:PLL-like beta propeller domain-containing protein n=1 Tax=Actinospica durhamensis TaxID=1508375 RepID=A0A941EUS5_9ACTN|nr:hypothetical protein [Actinospica durhamensis]MBR7837381.1 hypothetical protein [Actinospica durhamensis]